MPNENEHSPENTQSLQKTTQNKLELQNQPVYSDYVAAVLNAYFLDTLRVPLDTATFNKTVASWEMQFRDADVPASRLMEIYRTTMRKNESSFNFIGSLLETWGELRIADVVKESKVCDICKGTKRAMRMDFNTGKDVEVDCICKR